MQNNKTALVWFTNNLRAEDNYALNTALKSHEHVVAIFTLNNIHHKKTSFGFKKIEHYRLKFLLETLETLKINLQKINIPFLFSEKESFEILPEICRNLKINTLFLQKEFTDEEEKNTSKVKEKLGNKIKVIEVFDQFLYHPNDIPYHIDEIPNVFTYFRKKLEKDSEIRSITPINSIKKIIKLSLSSNIPTLKELGYQEPNNSSKSAFTFSGGETAALQRLDDYFFNTKKLGLYKSTRNGLLGTDYSSKFSPWLANGSISAKTIFWKVKEYEKEFGKNESTYWLIFELIWRDFFKYTALKHKNNLFKLNGILNKEYDWNSSKVAINNWIHGTTSEPFVNANMIELKETGWMSNRGRQNVSSYFTKELKLDWRIGAEYFESMLLDYDVHSNYGNWQYVAGVGNDPRNRKFNIRMQANRYDPNNKYQNKWLQTTSF